MQRQYGTTRVCDLIDRLWTRQGKRRALPEGRVNSQSPRASVCDGAQVIDDDCARDVRHRDSRRESCVQNEALPNAPHAVATRHSQRVKKSFSSKTESLHLLVFTSPLSPGLVKTSTSSTTLKRRPDSLAGWGTLSEAVFEEEREPVTPAFTVPVETLAPDPELEAEQSDAPTSSTEPHRSLETPSPTVSSFAQYPEGAQTVDIHTPSRAPSTARQTIRSSLSRLKSLSKASIRAPSQVSKRALSHLRGSRKSSKAPSTTNEVAVQDTNTYVVDPDPFRSSTATSQDPDPGVSATETAPVPEVAPITQSPVLAEPTTLTEDPREPEPEPDPDPSHESQPSSKAPSTVTPRRSSLRSSISKLGASIRQSSRVSFKALSRISSSGRSKSDSSLQDPAFDLVSPLSNFTQPSTAFEAVFPASPEFPPPRTRSRTSSKQQTAPPSLLPLSQTVTTVPEAVSPLDLTASPSVHPSEIDSPAATTLPPSRPQSWLFPRSYFTPPATLPPETEPGLRTPSAPRSPPKELDPEAAPEPVQENQPETASEPVQEKQPEAASEPVQKQQPEAASESVQEQRPAPSRPPTAKSSLKSLLRRTASSSQVSAPHPAVHQRQSSAASTASRQPSATSLQQPSVAPSTHHQPSAPPSAYRQPSAPPSTHHQPSAPPSTRRQSSAPPSTRRQPSVPSAVSPHRADRSASSTTPVPVSTLQSRAPSSTARSSESILFPRSSPFVESLTTVQPPLPSTRAPSSGTFSQNPITDSSTFPPTHSVQSNHSRRSYPSKVTHSRSASRRGSRRTSRTVTRLPSIISSRASKSNPNLVSGSGASVEQVATSLADSPAAPPVAINLSVQNRPSTPSSPASSRGSSRKSRSRTTTRIASAKTSLRSLTRIPISALGSKKESHSHLSKTSSQPSQQPSQVFVDTHVATSQPPQPSPAPAPPPPENRAPSHKTSLLSRLATSQKPSSSRIFQPSRQPSRHFAPLERTALPEQLIAPDGERIVIPPEILARMPFNEDESPIDGGVEQDFEGYTWFANPPPKPEPKAPETVSPPYVPMPGVVEQNEAFIYALQAAPNVLYANYKQYGQLGVLGWCAEFSELIDHLKTLGFEGNMFVNTRTQALTTCQELLKLRLDIKMQIIILYLSSQVARLRRFLDGEGKYDDYPEPEFPLDITRTYG